MVFGGPSSDARLCAALEDDAPLGFTKTKFICSKSGKYFKNQNGCHSCPHLIFYQCGPLSCSSLLTILYYVYCHLPSHSHVNCYCVCVCV